PIRGRKSGQKNVRPETKIVKTVSRALTNSAPKNVLSPGWSHGGQMRRQKKLPLGWKPILLRAPEVQSAATFTAAQPALRSRNSGSRSVYTTPNATPTTLGGRPGDLIRGPWRLPAGRT